MTDHLILTEIKKSLFNTLFFSAEKFRRLFALDGVNSKHFLTNFY